jgi:hypothetical protein
VGIHLATVYNSVTTVCAKAFNTYIRATVPVATILAFDVSGTGIFH